MRCAPTGKLLYGAHITTSTFRVRHFWVGALLVAGCARNIAPVPVAVTKSEAQLARGAYLAQAVMACGACHAERDWTKSAGPVKEGTEFAGSGDLSKSERFPDSFSFSAPNLTPGGALASWSDGELARAIVFGQRPDHRGLFPLMPYFEYRESLAADDLAALVAYLRSLSPIAHDAVSPVKFPMPGFVLNRFPEERVLRAVAPVAGAPGYGKYLAEIGGCAGCHTAADKRGNFTGPRFAGGREFPVPAPGTGTVRSANLTPDVKTGLGSWSRGQFIARFKSATLEQARTQELVGGFNSVMPWWAWARMQEEDLGAIYDYLRTVPATEQVVVKHTP